MRGKDHGGVGANIDMLGVIGRFEDELERGATPDRQAFLLAIIERWQGDEDLRAESRRRAAEVLKRFARGG